MPRRATDLLPAHAQRLLGPRYALLRPEYAETRLRLSRCNGAQAGAAEQLPVRPVLIFFGGTDPDDLSSLALEAPTDPALTALSVDLVVGANNPHRQRHAALADARGNTRLHPPSPHLADLMAEADLAIGAGGTTTWERCCLGLPSLVVSIADNQRPACEALAATHVIDYVGHTDAVTSDRLGLALRALLDNPGQRQHQHLAAAGAERVDGQGVQRVIAAMQPADTMMKVSQ